MRLKMSGPPLIAKMNIREKYMSMRAVHVERCIYGSQGDIGRNSDSYPALICQGLKNL